MSLSLESSDALASFYGSQDLLEKEILTPDEIYDRIDQVSTKDILEVYKDIFKPTKLNLSIIGPFKDHKVFEKILKL